LAPVPAVPSLWGGGEAGITYTNPALKGSVR